MHDAISPDDPRQGLFEFLQRHLVGLVVKHEPLDPDDTHPLTIGVASGFIMELDGFWFFTTAGHVFNDIARSMERRPARRFRFYIVDAFSRDSLSKELLPLDLFTSEMMFEDCGISGRDFGQIALFTNTCRLMRANGVVPVVESHWLGEEGGPRDDSRIEYFEHMMFGIIQERVSQVSSNSAFFGTAGFRVTRLEGLESPPSWAQGWTQPMFYAELPDLKDVNDIKGMSGCPIVGFYYDGNGRVRYNFVAIQSGWLSHRNPQIIYANQLVPLAHEYLARVKNRTGIDPFKEM